jgi:ABC-type dipeptide/oligopeptide/nickel transport system permease subunit
MRWSHYTLLLFVLMGLFGLVGRGSTKSTPALPPGARDAQGGWHILGTDNFGFDVGSGLLLGANTSLWSGIGHISCPPGRRMFGLVEWLLCR